MAIAKREYALKVATLGERTIQAGNRYADYSKTADFKTTEELEKFRKGWLIIVDDFRLIQSELNSLEVPEGLKDKGQELKEAYQKYVDYIEEKTIKFGAQALQSGEIALIQKLELEQSKKIVKITEEISKEF